MAIDCIVDKRESFDESTALQEFEGAQLINDQQAIPVTDLHFAQGSEMGVHLFDGFR